MAGAGFVTLWEFRVAPGRQAEFERNYGPGGPWIPLFRRAPGYLGSELLQDNAVDEAKAELERATDARGVITTYGYDTLNRLESVSYNVGSTGVPATATVTYAYGTNQSLNERGRLKTVTDGVGSETFEYDTNMPWVKKVTKVIRSMSRI